MFEVRWFDDHCTLVHHPPGLRITEADIASKDLLFVWGFLMDPAFIRGLLGRHVPFGPAMLPGYRRKPIPEGKTKGFELVRAPGCAVQGVVLLRLKAGDMRKLDDFEEAPAVMQQRTVRIRVGDLERKARIYMRKGA